MLKKNFRKEWNFFSTLSFKEYITGLFFPKYKSYIYLVFRFLVLYPLFKFSFDLVIFVLWVVFNFYFVLFERVFEFFRKLNFILFENWIIFGLNLKIINFFRYIFLFMFFVNIHTTMKRRYISFSTYLFEFFANRVIRFLRRRFKFRAIFFPFIKIYEIILVLLFMICSTIASFIDYFLFPLFQFFYHFIYLRLLFIFRYIGLLFKMNTKDPFLFSDVALFQISSMLQKNGFVAPECENNITILRAKIAYQAYRRKYLSYELTPDVIDSAGLNIYIFLKEDLLKDTRYERKFFGFFDVLVVIFPYCIPVRIFFFITNFLKGVIFITYIICLPLVLFYMLCIFLKYTYEYLEYWYYFIFKDEMKYYIKIKKRENRYDKFKKYQLKILGWFQYLHKSTIMFIKQIYAKIFR